MEQFTLAEVIEQVENSLLNLLIEALETGNMDVDEASKVARRFLNQFPLKDEEDIKEKLRKLGRFHKAALQVYDEFSTKNLRLQNALGRSYEEFDLPKNSITTLHELEK